MLFPFPRNRQSRQDRVQTGKARARLNAAVAPQRFVLLQGFRLPVFIYVYYLLLYSNINRLFRSFPQQPSEWCANSYVFAHCCSQSPLRVVQIFRLPPAFAQNFFEHFPSPFSTDFSATDTRPSIGVFGKNLLKFFEKITQKMLTRYYNSAIMYSIGEKEVKRPTRRRKFN